MNPPLKAYGRIQWLGATRLWSSLPLLFRIAIFVFIPILLSGLYKITIEINNWKSIAIISIIYLAICNSFNPVKAEKILIHNYKVSFRLIFFIRVTLIALTFFLIHWKAGSICLLTGWIFSIFKPDKISTKKHLSKFKPSYPFKTGSFQWFSFYRQIGFYIHCASILGIVMGILHKNPNLSLVSFGLTGIIPGIFSQIQMEPLFFLKSYLNPNELIRQKTIEIFYNISILQLPACILLILFGLNYKHVILIFISTIIISWLNLALKYIHYSNELAYFIFAFIVLPVTLLFLIAGSWLIIAAIGIILISGYFMKQNLNRIFNPVLE